VDQSKLAFGLPRCSGSYSVDFYGKDLLCDETAHDLRAALGLVYDDNSHSVV
jgi:hypothetical protein